MEIFDPADMPRPIAFVFGGGASATAAQVGMLKAAVEFGLKPDLVIGTSAGALNGALLADDPHTAVERLTDIWTSLDRRSALPDSLVRQVLNIRRREHWFADHGLRALFTAHLEARDFADLEIPFACVATDLADGSIALLDTGDIESALLASCALPGIFPVVRRGDRLLIDGGCVAYVPARQAVDFGARSLVIMDGRPGVMPPRKHEHVDVRDTVAVAFAAALESQCRAELELAAQLVPTVNLAGRPDRHVGAFDFGHGAELITSAYEAAVRDLEFRAIQRNPSHRLTDGHIANHTGYAQA